MAPSCPSEPAGDLPLDAVEAVLAEVLKALDDGLSVEQTLAQHPEHAPAVRRRLAHLKGIGLDRVREQPVSRRVGSYRLVSLLGRGGMGEVWLAECEGAAGQVALKLLPLVPLAQSAKLRFQREAETLARLDHPGVVRVLDSGEVDGVSFMAMEYVAGKSLDATLEEQTSRDVRLIVGWVRDVARALEVVHGLGIVHRDIKPQNIQITPDGRPVLIDFGLTRGVEPSSLSRSGGFIGSPLYAAPEQVRGERNSVGPRSDIYGLGATLYDALSGRPPHSGSSVEQLFHQILTAEAKPLRRLNSGVPRDLETVVGKALEKRVENRYPSAGAFADDLDAVLGLRAVSARPPGAGRRMVQFARARPALTAAVVVLVLSAVGFGVLDLLTQRQERAERQQAARGQVLGAQRDIEAWLVAAHDLPDRIAAHELERQRLETRANTSEQVADFDREQRDIERTSTRRERVFTEAAEAVRRAQDLDRDVAGAGRVLARMDFEQWRLARASGDVENAIYFAARVRKHDPGGDLAAAVAAPQILDIVTDPPGARVDAFRYVRHDRIKAGGQPRLVPIPWRTALAESTQQPGSRPTAGVGALKVRRAAGDLHAGDMILSVAGAPVEGTVFVSANGAGLLRGDRILAIDKIPTGAIGAVEHELATPREEPYHVRVARNGAEMMVIVTAASDVQLTTPREFAEAGGVGLEVWRDGHRFEAEAHDGLTLRPTAAPLFHDPDSYVGETPLAGVPVEGDPLLVLIRKDGYEPLRIRWPIPSPERDDLRFRLTPQNRYPPPFVQVIGVFGRPLIVMDRELTCGEWLAFLNHERVQARINHGELDLLNSPPWPRGADGQFSFPAGIRTDFPAHGIRWTAAEAYAHWRTAQAAAAGKSFRFVLPRWQDFQAHTRVDDNLRRYPWGNHFRPGYAKSCFARALPTLEPILRYPIDESMNGLHDLVGGVSELADGWFWEEQGQRPLMGGSWVFAEPVRFELRHAGGILPHVAREFTGLRLALIDEDS